MRIGFVEHAARDRRGHKTHTQQIAVSIYHDSSPQKAPLVSVISHPGMSVKKQLSTLHWLGSFTSTGGSRPNVGLCDYVGNKLPGLQIRRGQIKGPPRGLPV